MRYSVVVFLTLAVLLFGCITEPAKEMNFTVSDNYADENYSLHEVINASGVHLFFQPPLPIYSVWYHNSEDRSDRHHLLIPVSNATYALSCLDFNDSTSQLCLAREESYGIIHQCNSGCEKDELDANGRRFVLEDLVCCGPDVTSNSMLCQLGANNSCEDNGAECYDKVGPCGNSSYSISEGGEALLPEGGILHVWRTAPGYTHPFGVWTEVSYFSQEMVLKDGVDGVQLRWEMQNGSNPALKSVFIPANSTTYTSLVD